MNTANIIQQQGESREECAKCDCVEHRNDQTKTDLSRRSIDWRDSGIVIDVDNHLFQAFDNLCDFKSRSSIGSESNPSSQIPTTGPNSGFIQRIILNQDNDGDSMLHLAAVGFSLDRVKDLIKLCDLNAINNMMQTPLHVAVLANRPEMVELLIKEGSQSDVHDRRGNTPLHLACQRGFIEIVDIILNPLMDGMQQQSPFLPRVNPSIQAMIEKCNFDGLTCIHLAAMNDKQAVIGHLVQRYGANLNVRDSKSGETILHKAIRQMNVELTSFILKVSEQHCGETDFSGRDALSTIKLLQDAQSSGTDIFDRLREIEVLVRQRMEQCKTGGGCCSTKQAHKIGTSEEMVPCVSDESISSSDYSDSD